MRFYKLLMILPVVFGMCASHDADAAKKMCSKIAALSYTGTQQLNDDEFVYLSDEERNRQTGYECDSGSACDVGGYIFVGSNHYHNNQKIDHSVAYVCRSGDDRWVPVCYVGGDTGYIENVFETTLKKAQFDLSKVSECDKNGTEFKVKCLGAGYNRSLSCVATDCKDGYMVQDGKCINDKGNPTPDPKTACTPNKIEDYPCSDTGFDTTGAKECARQCKADGSEWEYYIKVCDTSKGYSCEQYSDGIGCKRCKKGGGSSCYADPRRTNAELKGCCDINPSEAMPNWTTEKCVCSDPTKEFAFDAKGKGKCVAKGTVVEKPKCDCSTKVTVITAATSACGSSNATVTQAITTINAECSKSSDQCDGTTYQQAVTVINEIIASGACKVQSVEPAKPEINKQRLSDAVAAIDKYRSGLDVSVWKDKEGNFNTARLVSDSIAGVVLGTAGGLITSSVVKKNQIKSGFEDIVCTIGGQTVGSYGDEISVGIQ